MKLVFYILFSLFLFVSGQATQAINVSVVQLNQKTEDSIVDDTESYDKRDLLNSEIARTCNFIGNLVSYWERDNKSLAKTGSAIDDVLATALKTHPNFSKLGLTINELDDFKSLLNAKMPNSASEIFNGLKSHLDAGTSFENMQQMISGLKNNWGNFSDGSKWVFNYTSSSKGLTQFGGKKIRFELPTETEFGLRRIDIADVTNPSLARICNPCYANHIKPDQ